MLNNFRSKEKLKNKEIDLKEEERKFKIKKDEEEKKVFKITSKKPPIPLTARKINEIEPVIKIYPEFNPKLSRNWMRPMTVKAWETARTLATTPMLSERIEKSPDNELPDGFSLPSNWKSNKKIKPKTAAHNSRHSRMEKWKTMENLFQQKPRTSSAVHRSRNTFRLKSRTKEGAPLFGSTFSSNWFKGARSSIDFNEARKYETEILELQKEINDTKISSRNINQELNDIRDERRGLKIFLQQLIDGISNQMKTKIKTFKHSKGSKTMRKLVPTWNLQYEDQYKHIESKNPSLMQNSEEIESSNNLVSLKLIESKERIVRLIMFKSGLFQSDLQVKP